MAQFTKQAIINSFLKLLEETPLDKITVKDIVEDCGINWNTFYYYYHDIYALLEELFSDGIRRAMEEEHEDYETWQQGFLESLRFVRENKKIIEHIYHSISREQLEQYLYDVTDDILVQFVRTHTGELAVREETIRFVASIYKFALVGMILEWIRDGMKSELLEIIDRVGYLFEGVTRQILEKSLDK